MEAGDRGGQERPRLDAREVERTNASAISAFRQPTSPFLPGTGLSDVHILFLFVPRRRPGPRKELVRKNLHSSGSRLSPGTGRRQASDFESLSRRMRRCVNLKGTGWGTAGEAGGGGVAAAKPHQFIPNMQECEIGPFHPCNDALNEAGSAGRGRHAAHGNLIDLSAPLVAFSVRAVGSVRLTTSRPLGTP